MMLSERSQTPKATYGMIPFMQNVPKSRETECGSVVFVVAGMGVGERSDH